MIGTNNFTQNSAQDGGGMYIYDDSIVEMTGTNTFRFNFAQEDGGGLYVYGDNTVVLNGTSSFIHSGGGDVCFVQSNSTVTLNEEVNCFQNSTDTITDCDPCGS